MIQCDYLYYTWKLPNKRFIIKCRFRSMNTTSFHNRINHIRQLNIYRKLGNSGNLIMDIGPGLILTN